ncbi:hypothetical protein HPP92_007453 [Vanilla planifolia]|uniref:Uncharacterized protein n=1 Tax=Vanilla planifolia TaxID=51239 RepID=A0A835RMG5_VANPL|nr:hypothetical protein HPP92_007453 [Vanilla planifolia]
MPSSSQTIVEDEGNEDDEGNRKKTTQSLVSSGGGALTSPASSATSPSSATINLRREYTLAVQTNSYNEMWAIIHRRSSLEDEDDHFDDEERNGEEILRLDRSSIENALRSARPTHLTRLVSRYLESSEQASDLFLALRRSVDLARDIYGPISQLLEVLPTTSPFPSPRRSTPPLLSQSQCDRAYEVFLDFDRRDNPFLSTADSCGGFEGMRDCSSVLKKQLELRFLNAQRKHRLLRRATTASATCLVISVVAASVTVLILVSHATAALTMAGPLTLCCGGLDLLERRRQKLRERMDETDAVARETYVLDNHLSTVERLVARLHATVESDKVLVRLGLERGRGQRHPIQEVVRQFRKNQLSFWQQLTDLDEHVCLCLAALNRARYLVLQQILL